ncbi:MAG: aldo/keto reductase [Betaproteobacteria bacterium]|nr:aldo/keto reductase [Betaproteobacteria bacterium]
MQAPVLPLNDGGHIPQPGLGTWQAAPDKAAAAVSTALKCGYRLIDTAAIYENEAEVGEGLRAGLEATGLTRDAVFITTKLWNSDQGFDSALAAFDRSLARLRLDYIDAYLIHWPCPGKDQYLASWKALIRLQEEKRVRSIGVSNFQIAHLERIIGETGVVPSINQIELHPDFTQPELCAFHAQYAILTQSWSPLGQGKLITHPLVVAIAKKHNRTPAQILIRWHIEAGLSVIPKSINDERIRENFNVFDFQLDAEDKTRLAGLDAPANRIGPNPDTADF